MFINPEDAVGNYNQVVVYANPDAPAGEKVQAVDEATGEILYKAVPIFQERWKKYPEQNWESECPKAPNKLVGKDTRFQSHPKKVDLNSDIQETLDDLDLDISKVKLTE